MPSLTELLIEMLAVAHLLECWLDGELFARFRAYLEARRESWLSKLLLCPLCLGSHLALLVSLVAGVGRCLGPPWQWWFQLPIVAAAVAWGARRLT